MSMLSMWKYLHLYVYICTWKKCKNAKWLSEEALQIAVKRRECYCYWQVPSVVSDSIRPPRRQPTRLPQPWDSPGKNTGVGCHFLSNAWKGNMKVKLLSHVRLYATPWTAAYQAPLTMGFSRREYWSGLPLPKAKEKRKDIPIWIQSSKE